MHVLLVHLKVKTEFIDAFVEAIQDNAKYSLKEAGVVRFDVLQQAEDPSRFTLVEVYRTASDHASHRETAHYLRWRDTVSDMMAEPRQGIRYVNTFPDDEHWNEK